MNLIGKNIAAKPYTTIFLYDAANGKLLRKLNYTRGTLKVVDQKYIYKLPPFNNELWIAVQTDPGENGGKLWLGYTPNIYSVVGADKKEVPLFIDQSIIDTKAEENKPSFLNLPKKILYGLGALGVLLILAKKYK